jgi:hypothetical protein
MASLSAYLQPFSATLATGPDRLPVEWAMMEHATALDPSPGSESQCHLTCWMTG